MVRQCQVCKTSNYWEPNLSLHRFPRDPAIRKMWFSLLGFPEYKVLPQSAEICRHHFSEKDFSIKPSGIRVLKAGALPIPFHTVTDCSSDSTPSATEELIKDLSITSKRVTTNIDNVALKQMNTSSSDSSSPQNKNLKHFDDSFQAKITEADPFPSHEESSTLHIHKKITSDDDFSSDTLTASETEESSADVEPLPSSFVTLTSSETEAQLVSEIRGASKSVSYPTVIPGSSRQRFLKTSIPKKRFPRDPAIRKMWFSLLGFPEYKVLPQSAEICRHHFSEKDFSIKPSGIRVLKAGALPIPFHTVTDCSSDSTPSATEELIKDLSITSKRVTTNIDNVALKQLNTSSSDSSSPQNKNLKHFDDSFQAKITEADPFPSHEESSTLHIHKKITSDDDFSSDTLTASETEESSADVEPLPSSFVTLTSSETEAQLVSEIRGASKSVSYATVIPGSSRQRFLKTSIPKKRKRFVGDFTSEDFATPKKSKKHFQMAKLKINKKQRKMKALQRSISRLRSKIISLNALLDLLREKLHRENLHREKLYVTEIFETAL